MTDQEAMEAGAVRVVCGYCGTCTTSRTMGPTCKGCGREWSPVRGDQPVAWKNYHAEYKPE